MTSLAVVMEDEWTLTATECRTIVFKVDVAFSWGAWVLGGGGGEGGWV